jgi:hypothetical protein
VTEFIAYIMEVESVSLNKVICIRNDPSFGTVAEKHLRIHFSGVDESNDRNAARRKARLGI